MKNFSNTYIFIYSAALVAVVAVLLAFIATSLKPRQEYNKKVEKMQMILRTVGVEATTANAEELYAKNITDSKVLGDDGDSLDVYRFATEQGEGYVIPMHGTGLWGPIWGYVAFDKQFTIVGTVFDHEGETPGLGGEISTPKFQERFVGKSIIENGTLKPVALKKNADASSLYEVDAISGGTLTSNGVTEMFAADLAKYKTFIEKEVSNE